MCTTIIGAGISMLIIIIITVPAKGSKMIQTNRVNHQSFSMSSYCYYNTQLITMIRSKIWKGFLRFVWVFQGFALVSLNKKCGLSLSPNPRVLLAMVH
jgi:hypothetical protein